MQWKGRKEGGGIRQDLAEDSLFRCYQGNDPPPFSRDSHGPIHIEFLRFSWHTRSLKWAPQFNYFLLRRNLGENDGISPGCTEFSRPIAQRGSPLSKYPASHNFIDFLIKTEE